MKIDKKNPQHWFALAAFFIQGIIGLILSFIRFNRRDARIVLLYGHKLNGNLLALYRYVEAHPELRLRLIFLSLDGAYLSSLKREGINVCQATRLEGAIHLSRACALVSDHGLHSLQPLLGIYQVVGLKFFDVWHGIPFKGFDGQDFRLQHRYDEVWVASDLCRELYINRFGFTQNKVQVTGYARTDSLIDPSIYATHLREKFNIPKDTRTIIFAPTWVQDDKGRNIYPFGCEESEFLEQVAVVASKYNAAVLFRSHLNSKSVGSGAALLPKNVLLMPSSDFPDTEEILQVSDILVCDWSSIAFDYLLLNRPAIFLDVPPPFRKGFSLSSEYRFGPIVNNMQALQQQLELCLGAPDMYWKENGDKHKAIHSRVYAEIADGLASKRCIKRLQEHTRLH